MKYCLKASILVLGTAYMFGMAAAGGPVSKTVTEVLREPLPPEDLSCMANDTTITIQGPTFRYVVDRATGAAEAIEAEGVPYRSILGLADLGLDDV